MITIKPIHSSADLKKFIDFPHELYKGSPYYVPELFIAQRDLLTKHPIWNHSSKQLFLALENDKIVGRIAAINNDNHNQFNQSNDGFFGFLDAIDNAVVFDKLFDAARNWLKHQGKATMIGPVNPSTNDSCGTLIEGFELSPKLMMIYNYPYYDDHIKKAGLDKKTDLLAYTLEKGALNDKSMKMMGLIESRLASKGIEIRNGNLKNFRTEVDGLRAVYNQAWDKNLGFVPMTDAEFDYMAKDMKLILDPDFCLIATHEGKPVGFALCLPDLNQVQKKVTKGRLLPTGIFKLLWGKKSINELRIIALGVVEGYRKMGIEAVFYGTIMKRGLEKGYKAAEASWILEDNEMMNRGIEHINGRVYKRYRLYEQSI